MKINVILIFLLASAALACGGSNNQNQQSTTEQELTAETDVAANAQQEHPGEAVYNAVCLACHMADGSGVPGMHPPLTGTERVNGDKEQLIDIVLNGMTGEIEVNGEIYNGIMPPNTHLTDKQIADVLTYIRSNFGNESSEITEEEVAEVRASGE